MGIYKRNGSWYFDFYHDGLRIRKKSKGHSRRLAELEMRTNMDRLVKGELGIDIPRVTLQQIVARYCEHSKQFKSPSTVKRIELSLNTFFRYFPALLKGSPEALKLEILDRYVQSRRQDGASPRTINIDLRTLKSMFHKAKEWKLVRESPVEYLKEIRVADRKPPRFLKEEEIQALLKEAKEHQVMYPLAYTALKTGMRAGELMNLYWDDIDFPSSKTCVRSHEKMGFHTKNYKVRYVPIDEKLVSVLKAFRESRQRSSPWIFRDHEGLPLLQNPLKALKIIARRAGLSDVTLHSLRHTYASHLVMAGVPLVTVKELLGHGSITTTMIYTHLAPDHLIQAAGKLKF